MTNLCVSYSLRSILWNNPNIQEIWCKQVTCSDIGIFAGLSLNSLRLTHFVDTTSCEGFPWHDTTSSNSLQTLVMVNCRIHISIKTSITSRCPRLKSLGDSDLDVITERLVNLDVEGVAATDDGILLIGQNLSALRTLNMRNCPNLTDVSLQYIADHAGSRLRILHSDIKKPESAETETIIENFARKCTSLLCFNVNCYDKMLCGGRGLSLLVNGCPKLNILVVNKRDTIGASSRDFIAVLRPNLRLLVQDASTVYNILLMPV